MQRERVVLPEWCSSRGSKRRQLFMNRGRAILAACIVLPLAAAVCLIFGRVSKSQSLPKLTVKITGTPGQTFAGIFRAYGGETSFSGTAPAEYSFGSTPVLFQVQMTGPVGALTNTVYRNGLVAGGGRMTMASECLEIERDSEGGLSVGTVPTNILLRVGDIVIGN
jgi:hypothetical protein